MAPPAIETEESAGGVLWRPSPNGTGLEICLISTRGSTRWQLPKGHLAPGESPADAARREVREETGCTGEIEDDLGSIVFWFYVGSSGQRRRINKTVQFYLFRYASGDTRNHDGEVDDATWLPAATAVQKLTFDSERKILVRALEVLERRR